MSQAVLPGLVAAAVALVVFLTVALVRLGPAVVAVRAKLAFAILRLALARPRQ
jgi:hypothetical protein